MDQYELRYQVDRIGIYIDTHNASPRWIHLISSIIKKRFEGTPLPNKKIISHHLILHDYHKRPQTTNGVIAPTSAFYNQTIISHTRKETCYQFDDKNQALHVWTNDPIFCASSFPLQQLLLSMGATLVHAATISVKGKTIVLPAFGNIGKTTLLANLRSCSDIKILSDDFIIIRPDGTASPFMRPMAILDYHRPLFSSYFKENPFPVRVKSWHVTYLIIRRLLLSIGIDITPYLTRAMGQHIPLTKLFDKIMLEHQPQQISCFLAMMRRPDISKPQLHPMAPEELTTFMSNMLTHELSKTIIPTIFRLNGTGGRLSNYFQKIESILEQAVNHVGPHCYQLMIPHSLAPQQFINDIVPLLYHVAEQSSPPVPTSKNNLQTAP